MPGQSPTTLCPRALVFGKLMVETLSAADSTSQRITVVIPTFRRARLLRRAITSVLAQEEARMQVDVYDNASGDDTAEVVSGLARKDGRIRYHCHDRNLGPAANFDYALRHVETPLFSILSDDDYLLPGFYSHALAGLAANPEAMFWSGMTINVDAHNRIWDARPARWPREGLFTPPHGFTAMTGAGFQPTWTGIVFRRQVLELEGYPDVDTMGPSDLEFCLRLAARFPYVVEKHPSAVFFLNDASFSSTQPLASFWPGWQRMLRRFAEGDYFDDAYRDIALQALRADARRMLFRRGANAVAVARLDFARAAAHALRADCGRHGRAMLLRTLAAVCGHSRLAQNTCHWTYRRAEQRIIRSRSELQDRYGHLLRSA